jgi:small subunit ribosomal protein S18
VSAEKARPKRTFGNRQRNTAKYQLPKDVEITYKDVPLLQKYLNDRGKVVPRRVSGVSSKDQRKLVSAIKIARYLALLISGSVKPR